MVPVAGAERPHRLSAGAIVARREDGQWLFLLLRCFAYWDFPKGELELAEDPLSGALRETAEETGLSDLKFRWGRQFYETPPYSRGKVARYYLAATANPAVEFGINPELGRPEHHEFRWTTLEEASSLLNDRVRSALSWAANIISSDSGTRCSRPGEPS
jgi:bis(5'-nucleosidyl)-tetraphosphatase